MEFNNVDEATRMVEELLNLKRENLISKEEALVAIKKVPHYSEVLEAAK